MRSSATSRSKVKAAAGPPAKLPLLSRGNRLRPLRYLSGSVSAARAEGWELEPLEAIESSVRELTTGAEPVPNKATPPQKLKAHWDGLTAREREPAVCVAKGQSKRQIARGQRVDDRGAHG